MNYFLNKLYSIKIVQPILAIKDSDIKCTPKTPGALVDSGVNTAIGCLSTDAKGGAVNSFISIAVGLGGGIALLLILFGVFLVTTSHGNPDKINQGKDIIVSAITGLVFIVLSVVLLNLIGISLLDIPGLD